MKLLRPICLLGLALTLVPALPAGSIIGTVTAKAPTADTGAAGGGAYASRRYKFVERVDYDDLTDFVVYIDQAVPGGGEPAEAKVVQRDATFEPHVLPVEVGTRVSWPNEDDIYHNVFSMSDAKPFNLNLYRKGDGPPPAEVFDRVGRVDVFCGIHSKMHCIVLVLPSRFFAVADRDGRYVIKGVPPGTYRLRAWHERLPAQTAEITVPAEGEVRADFVLTLANLPHN